MNSRAKGQRFERELAARFRECGYDAYRAGQEIGNSPHGVADVVGLPGIHVEAKHCEQFRIYDWMDQAKRDAAKQKDGAPVVFFRKNHCETLVTMRLDDWMMIYREWEEGR